MSLALALEQIEFIFWGYKEYILPVVLAVACSSS